MKSVSAEFLNVLALFCGKKKEKLKQYEILEGALQLDVL